MIFFIRSLYSASLPQYEISWYNVVAKSYNIVLTLRVPTDFLVTFSSKEEIFKVYTLSHFPSILNILTKGFVYWKGNMVFPKVMYNNKNKKNYSHWKHRRVRIYLSTHKLQNIYTYIYSERMKVHLFEKDGIVLSIFQKMRNKLLLLEAAEQVERERWFFSDIFFFVFFFCLLLILLFLIYPYYIVGLSADNRQKKIYIKHFL